MFAVFAFYPIGTTAREKYHVKEIYLMQEARQMLKAIWIFLFFGRDGFHLTEILSLGKEPREFL